MIPSIIGALGPVTTIVFGWLGLEEVMTPLQLAGSGLVLVGVVVISLKPAPTKAALTGRAPRTPG